MLISNNTNLAFNKKLDGLLDCKDQTDAKSFYDKLTSILVETAEESIPVNSYNPHTKPYWSKNVKTAHKREREARKVWVSQGRPRGMQFKTYSDYKRAKRDFRIIQNATYEQYI